jgi:hypothetical protein
MLYNNPIMKKIFAVSAAAFSAVALSGCLCLFHKATPPNGHSVFIDTVRNKTQQFGLEDALQTSMQNQLLDEGYKIADRSKAEGVLTITLETYLLVPTQTGANLVPTAYQLTVTAHAVLKDPTTGKVLWSKNGLSGVEPYAAVNMPGGMTEQQAQAVIWDMMTRNIVVGLDVYFVPVKPATPTAKGK